MDKKQLLHNFTLPFTTRLHRLRRGLHNIYTMFTQLLPSQTWFTQFIFLPQSPLLSIVLHQLQMAHS